MARGVSTLASPGHRLAQGPEARPLPIEPQVRRQPIQPPNDFGAAVAELIAANDRREREFTLADERLRIDHEPWLAQGAQHVIRVQILMQQHLSPLRSTKPLERLQRE